DPELPGLIERFAWFRAPAQSIRWALESSHANAVFLGIAARIPCDNDVVTGFQGIAVDVLPAQLAGPAPLDAPALHDAFLIRSVDLNERMWISELELNDRTLDLRGAIFVIRRRERMMGVQPGAGSEQDDTEQHK